jgi:hypothetical protein
MDDLSFEEMVDRLRLAQELVRDETERLTQAEPGDHRASLWRLGKVARNHQEQANDLLVSMLDQSAPENLLQEAEGLAGFFNSAVSRIEAMLGSGRGWG